MRLKGIALKGFKSFPERTVLEFAPGVSVVVGPNGSGKSNVTDAVLWAMGEQSPLAVRGQSMQDIIFSGGHGRQAARAAEVELVFDNSGGELPVPAAEVSVLRKLDRNGEGEYRINGARCRMTDVLELLSDSGLGKEGHSVIGQGRVEAIVTSKPRDRRLLIEEAAGLGKHRRRRRRAQLKLDRTRDNLDRALDIEREARAHLRPLKRQAEAAEIHARLERQILEARWSLVRDDLFGREDRVASAEAAAAKARSERETLAAEAAGVAAKRSEAEEELAGRAKRRDDLAQRTFSVRAATERLGERIESVKAGLTQIDARIGSDSAEMARIEGELATGGEDPQADRRARLVARLTELDAELGRERAGEVEGLEAKLAEASGAVEVAKAELVRIAAEAERTQSAVVAARQAQSDADRERDRAAGELKRAERELDQLEAFLRENGGAPAGARALADGLDVDPGCELAVAAVLGGRLSAAVVDSFESGSVLLDGVGDYGGRAIVVGGDSGAGRGAGTAPGPGARLLADCISGDSPEARLAKLLLADSWLVTSLDSVPRGFAGIAATSDGRSWVASVGELNQVPKAGAARVLAERNRLDGLRTSVSDQRDSFERAVAAVERTRSALSEAEAVASAAAEARRESVRMADSAAEELRRAEWLIEARRKAPQAGPVAVERAEVAAELAAEERIAARMAAERDGSAARLAGLAERLRRDRAMTPSIRALIQSLEAAAAAIVPLRERLDSELAGDGEEGEGVAAALRQLAAQEAAIQAKVAALGEQVTAAEVESQRLRDRRDESKAELSELAAQLGLDEAAPEEILAEDARELLEATLERLERRRSQLGPVNPLAADEYRAALEHLEELEAQRKDLESALVELKGLVRDCDRTIRETFEETFAAASDHFEDLVEKLFPGGKGRLRLVTEESGPKQVLGGGEPADGQADGAEAEVPDSDEFDEPDVPQMGVEIEITPAGKTMRRLSLLSGGEKSMTAIAFIFAVFLAKPCPFYILDEVEAALDDLNLGRFLELLKAYRDQAQFIVVTHQRRTMEAADALYGVSMGGDGVSKVISRKLGDAPAADDSLAA
ncbi:MAG: AAA family ATPase [Actinomycetes bacterium]